MKENTYTVKTFRRFLRNKGLFSTNSNNLYSLVLNLHHDLKEEDFARGQVLPIQSTIFIPENWKDSISNGWQRQFDKFLIKNYDYCRIDNVSNWSNLYVLNRRQSFSRCVKLVAFRAQLIRYHGVAFDNKYFFATREERNNVKTCSLCGARVKKDKVFHILWFCSQPSLLRHRQETQFESRQRIFKLLGVEVTIAPDNQLYPNEIGWLGTIRSDSPLLSSQVLKANTFVKIQDILLEQSRTVLHRYRELLPKDL